MPATWTYRYRRNGAHKIERRCLSSCGCCKLPDSSSSPQIPLGAARVQLQPKLTRRWKLSYRLCGPSAGRSSLISRGRKKKIPSLQSAGPAFKNCCAQVASVLATFPRRAVLKNHFPICCANISTLHHLFAWTCTFGDYLANFPKAAFSLNLSRACSPKGELQR